MAEPHHAEQAQAPVEAQAGLVRSMAVVAGLALVVWALCAALRWAVDLGTDELHHYLLVHEAELHAPLLLLGGLALGGLAAGALMRLPGWGQTSGDGLDVAIDNVRCTHAPGASQPRFERPTFALALRKLATTALTLGTGGSGGLATPMALAGEAVAAGVARWLRAVRASELRTYQLAGMAAGLATLLGAPFAAALLAIEIVERERVLHRHLAGALVASLVACTLDQRLLGRGALFEAPPHAYVYSLAEQGVVVLVAVAVAAPLALGFGRLVGRAGVLVSRVDPIQRVTVGALACGLVAVGLWKGLGIAPYHVLGMGENTLGELLAPGAETTWTFLLAALAGKMLATGFTIGAGGSAGLVIPSLFVGGVSCLLVPTALAAAGLGAWAGEPAIFVITGMAAALVAVGHVPAAAIALVLELFGPTFGAPAALACVVTYVLTARFRVYGAQRGAPEPQAGEPAG
jgi:CIC family chloride channel protein